jgi:hypothetical protein
MPRTALSAHNHVPASVSVPQHVEQGCPPQQKESNRQPRPINNIPERRYGEWHREHTAVDMHCVIKGWRVKCPLYHRYKEAMVMFDGGKSWERDKTEPG